MLTSSDWNNKYSNVFWRRVQAKLAGTNKGLLRNIPMLENDFWITCKNIVNSALGSIQIILSIMNPVTCCVPFFTSTFITSFQPIYRDWPHRTHCRDHKMYCNALFKRSRMVSETGSQPPSPLHPPSVWMNGLVPFAFIPTFICVVKWRKKEFPGCVL